MTDHNTTSDPLDSVMDTEYTPRGSTYFGQIGVDVWYAALEKGRGKVDFDPAIHAQDRRVTAIKIAIDAMKRDGTTFALEREMIAESKEWATIVKPSLRALNADLRGINNKWAKVELVSTGQTYTNKQGEEKQRTTIKFLAIYESENECQDASTVFYAGGVEPETPRATSNGSNGTNAEKETAKAFLAPLWKVAGGDLTKFQEVLASTAPVNKYFKIDSPEVLAVIGK